MDLIISLNKENGESFVIVTHSLDVGKMAHRIVQMHDGMVVDDGLGGPAKKVPATATA